MVLLSLIQHIYIPLTYEARTLPATFCVRVGHVSDTDTDTCPTRVNLEGQGQPSPLDSFQTRSVPRWVNFSLYPTRNDSHTLKP